MNTEHCPKTGQFTFKRRNLYLSPLQISITQNNNGILLSPAPKHPKLQVLSAVAKDTALAIRSVKRAYRNLPQEHFDNLKSIQACAGKDLAGKLVISTKDNKKKASISRAISSLQRRFKREGGTLTGGYVWDTSDAFIITDAINTVDRPQTYQVSTGSTLVGAALHELGHSVYDNAKLLPKRMIAHIQNMFEDRKSTGNHLTVYASTNAAEYFAEGYSLYIHRPKYLKARDPELYTILNTKVFRGVSYKEATLDGRWRK